MLFLGRDGSRWHGEHVSGSLCDGERGASLWRSEVGGSHREGRPYGCLQQISHGIFLPGLLSLTSIHILHDLCVWCLRGTAQKTQPRKAAFPERSRTPTPLTRTRAAKQHGSQESWPKRWFQSASHKKVSYCLLLHHNFMRILSYTWNQRVFSFQ